MNDTDRGQCNHIVQQAWIGFWQSCMRDVGATSRLAFDEAIVGRALNGDDPIEHKGKSAWARQLEGDARISEITLGDVLLGLDDYFRIFRQMKKINPHAYEYFSRVGAPLCFESGTRAWADAMNAPAPIVNPADLPAYFGVFMTRKKETARDDLINDKPTMLDFQLYEKRRRNIRVAAPWKWTIYDHAEFSLDRDVLTKAERRKFPHAGAWGFHYYIGVGLDGVVQALPMQMNNWQALKNGGSINHSQFVVPPGLKDFSGRVTVDQFVAIWFAAIRAFGAAALSGVQLSVRKGNEVARFGIPLAYVRSFFRDREREGARRRALLHFVSEYHYQRGNRQVTVGEHLRGARRFTWRDYSITISAPGIHHSSPEALSAEMLTDEDILPLPSPSKTITIGELADTVRRETENAPRVPFRRGEPTSRFPMHSLEIPAPPVLR